MPGTSWLQKLIPPVVLVASASGCMDDPTAAELGEASTTLAPPAATLQCDADNGGLVLPPGFCAIVVADLVMDGRPARARHMAVTGANNLFVAVNSPRNRQPSFGIIGLHDGDGDGRADQQTQFSPGLGGNGLAWRKGYLYFGANDRVLRFRVPSRNLVPKGEPEVLVSGLADLPDNEHISTTVVLGDLDKLFVGVGSASDSCQVANRQPDSPGVFPCPELPVRAGVWLFNSAIPNQAFSSGEHYASGLRNMVALAFNTSNNELYGVQHGRERLSDSWSEFFTAEQDAVQPAEEFLRIGRGSDNGWPYCYYDGLERQKVLAPEYGGDGRVVSGGPGVDCSAFNQPLVGFPAHWAPNGLLFYRGQQFPARYRQGAFIAFHGSSKERPPVTELGYNIVFVPMKRGAMSGPPETFADGFMGPGGVKNPRHRPVGVTEAPDGSLYISDDHRGRIWRVIYTGQ
jgi:glucose/arabinose dehydrogenase